MNKPSPADFAIELAKRYGPAPDPGNPYFKPAAVAVRRLVLQTVVEVFGLNDPLGQFLSAFAHAERLSFPLRWSEAKTDALEACLDDMRAAWEIIEQDTQHTIEAMRN